MYLHKKQVIRRRRMIVAAVCVAALAVILLLVRGVIGLFGALGDSQEAQDAQGAGSSDTQALSAPSGGSESVTAPWYLMLVNEEHPLTEGYVPTLTVIETHWEVDERIAGAAVQMLDGCREAGLSPMICSAFRSVEKQQELFDDRVARNKAEGMSDEEAQTAAAEIVAIPGTSEHHTGLALDIVSSEYQLLDEGQEETPEYQWLREHCAEYGFILRYPPDKTDETGIIYEPWHFRYVGKEAAKEIMEQGITLERYLQDNQ